MSFNNIPDELVLQILEYVILQDRTVRNRLTITPLATIVSLARASRRLHRLATPLVYSQVNFKFDAVPEQLMAFIRTIELSQSLGHMLKRLYWENSRPTNYTVEDFGEEKAKTIKHRVWLFSGITVQYWRWNRDCARKVHQSEIPSQQQQQLRRCLQLAPNLERLHVAQLYFEPFAIDCWTDAIRFKDASSFQRLESVSIQVARAHWSDLTPIIMLPSMRKFELSGICALDGVDTLTTVLPRTSRIESLHLVHCCLNIGIVTGLLDLCSQLKRFEHHFIDDKEPFSSPNYKLLIESLAQHAESLTYLSIYDSSDRGGPRKSLLPPLTLFHQLKELHLPYTCLYKLDDPANRTWTNILPENLEKLGFLIVARKGDPNYTASHINQVFEMLAGHKQAGSLSKLGEVLLDESSMFPSNIDPRIWQDTLADAEVELLTYWPDKRENGLRGRHGLPRVYREL